MSTPRGRGRNKRRFHSSPRCKYCNKVFNNNRDVYQHESAHDYFSCIHCMKQLKSKPFQSLQTSSSVSSDLSHITPRLFITIDNPTTFPNAASSNPNTNHNNPRKRKFIELASNPTHEPQPPIPKKPRISSVSASDILNLVSEEEEEEESSLSSEFTDGDIIQLTQDKSQPTQSTANKTMESSESDIDIITSYKKNIKQSKQETDSDDMVIITKPQKDREDDVIVMPLPASATANGNDTTSTASNSPTPQVIDWKQLDFKLRNPDHFRRMFYQNINRNMLSHLLHKNISHQILEDIRQTRPNDTEMKLKQFLVEFVVHKIGVLMKDRKYFRKRHKTNADLDYSQFVHLYGSLASKIDSAQCDVDIAIEIPHSVEPKFFLRQLANMLQKHTIKQGKKFKIERILNAKIPILKLTDPLYKIEADISIYKSHDLCVKYINSLLDYKNDKRVRQLLIAIKHWTKKRNINCAMTGKINSFGFTILVLKYLQFVRVPVLPVMDWKQYDVSQNEMEGTTTSDAYAQKCKEDPLYKYYTTSYEYHSMTVTPAKTQTCVNDMSLSELLYGFFEFYSNFDFEQNQISLHSHSIQTKQIWDYEGSFTREQLTFVIQDPIETKNNCAKNVRQHTMELLVNEFRRAQFILLYGGDWIHDVCADTTLQPNCFDVVTLSTEALYYKQHERNMNQQGMVEYVQQYVVDKAITSEDMYYGYYNNLNRKKRQKKKKNKNKKKKSKRYYLRRTNSY